MRLTLNEVTHEFSPGRALFRPVTGTFVAGETVALMGPSGAGKSTLLAIMGGLVVPSGGSVARDGEGRACWVTQNPHGVSARLARDHVVLPLLARGSSRREAEVRSDRILDEFGLSDIGDQPFSTLSGGQAQRLMLARGVAANPALLLVDEPTAQLDQETAAEVEHSLQRLADRGILVFVATHSASTQAACQRGVHLERVSSNV
ncbi:ATP-binding cassette domain-containing protein [Agromyces allii]|uniref:ATP-binding cassette domain-containing protein n=1 Tax=Agromyces allii TaxID=393607 RepID=A0ABP5BYA9_9MICO|nr:ATP-binding cassette domain-containing protein [Agromyces allii]